MKGGKVSGKELNYFIKASYSKDRPNSLGDYMLDKEISKGSVAVYHNPKTKDTKVIHRGTEGTKEDWANNLAYISGQYEKTDRYKRSKVAQERAEKKYGAENIDTLGHSQGAILSSKLGKNTRNIINVNPAYMGEATGSNVTNIRSSGDVVSSLLTPTDKVKSLFGYKPKGKTETIKAESWNPLTEHKGDILLRDENKMYGKGIMNKEKVAFLKEHGITIRKVRGEPYYDIKVGKSVHSRYGTKKEAKKCMCGGGFWKDFGKGFTDGFLGTAKVVQGISSFDPDKIEQGAKRVGKNF